MERFLFFSPPGWCQILSAKQDLWDSLSTVFCCFIDVRVLFLSLWRFPEKERTSERVVETLGICRGRPAGVITLASSLTFHSQTASCSVAAGNHAASFDIQKKKNPERDKNNNISL